MKETDTAEGSAEKHWSDLKDVRRVKRGVWTQRRIRAVDRMASNIGSLIGLVYSTTAYAFVIRALQHARSDFAERFPWNRDRVSPHTSDPEPSGDE